MQAGPGSHPLSDEMKGTLMLDMAEINRRTGRDWPYSEEEMRRAAAQRDYPPAGRTTARKQTA
jgi:hypothetical protein